MHSLETKYRKLVLISAIYDLIVTLPFALPGLVSMQLATLSKIQLALGLSGVFPVIEPVHLFFLNLFGTIVCVWSVLRIVKPEPLFGLVDGLGRAAFSSLMIYYLVVWSIPQIVVLFLVPEVLFGIAQLGGYWLYHQSDRMRPRA
jgi:hypothetical protein